MAVKKTSKKPRTAHFSYNEFVATSHRNLQAANYDYASDYTDDIFTLFCVLEFIRHLCGFPIRITSGARCPELNELVGGVKNSRHLCCRAADIAPHRVSPTPSEFAMLRKACFIAQNAGLLGYVEFHPDSYVHINLP